MKVNLTIVEKLAGFALPTIDEVVARVNARLGGIEAVTNLGEQYGGARIVRVVECVKHPDADRLSVTKIDDGGVTPDVPRDENGLVQVVCGAPNAHADMWAVWLPPKTAVPASIAEGEPFVLDARPLRGILSQGMLAAADELAIGTDHEGIVEITERDMPSGMQLTAGASFAEVFDLTGFVLDIENKMFTHRPDCFGQLGVAREIAGIFGHQFTSLEWYKAVQDFAAASGLNLTVANEAPDKVPRFMAVAIDGVTVGPSPLWLQCQLVAMGGKPINNIVDATNYVMLMTAQPTHAYDYDKVRGQALIARMAHEGERLTLLSGKEIQLTADDIVIADGERAIGLAGIMGGADTEVSAETTRVILECANFDMYAVRRTAMRHGVFTDALARFNKGQSPLQTAPVLHELMQLVGGRQASRVSDNMSKRVFDLYRPETNQDRYIVINPVHINERLGTDINMATIESLLANVEFIAQGRLTTEVESSTSSKSAGVQEEKKVKHSIQSARLKIPFWRTDITLPEDIVEEVGRLYGFDRLPRELPRRSARPAPKNARRELKQAVRSSLSRAGANEVLSYSFVHERVLTNAEQDPSMAFKLSNALSPDLQYYRLSVLPSLLDKVHMNSKAGHDEFVLFEMGKGHRKDGATDEDGLPEANHFTDIVYTAKKPRDGAPFYRVRRLVEQLAHDLGISVVFVPTEEPMSDPAYAPFDQVRSAFVKTLDGQLLGVIGELKPSVMKRFKLSEYTAAASLNTAALESVCSYSHTSYQPLSRYPSTSQDISLRVAATTPVTTVQSLIREVIAQHPTMSIVVAPLTIYQPQDDTATKTLTFRLLFTAQDRTLTDKDTALVMNRIAERAAAAVQAERV